jgi:hypothetical protein
VLLTPEVNQKLGAAPGDRRMWYYALCAQHFGTPGSNRRAMEEMIASATSPEDPGKPLRVMIGKNDEIPSSL